MPHNVEGMVSDLLFANMHYNQCYPLSGLLMRKLKKNEYR